MKKPKTWHGSTYEQWFKLWDAARWREQVGAALLRIARSPHATMRDRLIALQSYNEAVMHGILPLDTGFPEFMRDALLEVISGEVKISHGRKKRQLRDQLRACRWMLQVGYEMSHLSADPDSPDPDIQSGPMLS